MLKRWIKRIVGIHSPSKMMGQAGLQKNKKECLNSRKKKNTSAVFTWAMCKSAQKMDKFLERQRKCDGCFGTAWGDCDHCSLNGDDEEESGEEK